LEPEDRNVTVFNIFDHLGATPHLCSLAAVPHALKHYELELNTEISNINLCTLEKIFLKVAVFKMDKMSHKLCLISRSDEGDIHSDTIVHIITDWIKSQLVLQLRDLGQAEQICLYKLFLRVQESRAMAGVLYEALVQSDLQHGISLIAYPMVKVEKSKRAMDQGPGLGSQPQWHSTHMLLHNVALEKAHQASLKQPPLHLYIRPDHCQEYSDGGLLSLIIPNVMYVPESTTKRQLIPLFWSTVFYISFSLP
jgi:hypothetical protein